jgi:hypothetical protein
MMPSSKTYSQSKSAGASSPGLDVLNDLPQDDQKALAALAGAPDGVAELTFNSFPSGTKALLVTYKLAEKQGDDSLTITKLGHQAIEAAAACYPAPYQDVSLNDLLERTQKVIDDIVRRSGVKVQEPSTHPVRQTTVASVIRRGGGHFIKNVQDVVAASFTSVRSKIGSQSEEPAGAGSEAAAEDHDHASAA